MGLEFCAYYPGHAPGKGLIGRVPVNPRRRIGAQRPGAAAPAALGAVGARGEKPGRLGLEKTFAAGG